MRSFKVLIRELRGFFDLMADESFPHWAAQ